MPDEVRKPSEVPEQDPRVYLAAERTFLAWIRTGLALMGFGFVLARFGIFLRSLTITRVISDSGSPNFSVSVGTALITIGVIVELLSLKNYLRLISDLKAGVHTFDRPSLLAVAVAITMGATGAAMAVYLLFFR